MCLPTRDVATRGDVLSYSVAVDPGSPAVFAGASVAGNTLSVDFALDQNGTGLLILTATDDAGATATSPVTVNIAPVNDNPVLVGVIPDTSFLEDDPDRSVSIDVFDDVDIATNGDSLSYSVTSISNPSLFAGTAISGTDLIFTFAPDANGNADVTVRATDQAGCGWRPRLM